MYSNQTIQLEATVSSQLTESDVCMQKIGFAGASRQSYACWCGSLSTFYGVNQPLELLERSLFGQVYCISTSSAATIFCDNTAASLGDRDARDRPKLRCRWCPFGRKIRTSTWKYWGHKCINLHPTQPQQVLPQLRFEGIPSVAISGPMASTHTCHLEIPPNLLVSFFEELCSSWFKP